MAVFCTGGKLALGLLLIGVEDGTGSTSLFKGGETGVEVGVAGMLTTGVDVGCVGGLTGADEEDGDELPALTEPPGEGEPPLPPEQRSEVEGLGKTRP